MTDRLCVQGVARFQAGEAYWVYIASVSNTEDTTAGQGQNLKD